MPDPLVVTFPGHPFKAQMQSLQRILLQSFQSGEPLPIATIMYYVNLTESNARLERRLIQRGSLHPKSGMFVNEASSTLRERLHDTGEQLKEVNLEFRKKIGIKITEPAAGELLMDFRVGDKIIMIAKGLPDSTGLSESFHLHTIRFHAEGTETILVEEFGEGIVQIIVDYTRTQDMPLIVHYAGNSFKSKLINTVAATFHDSYCCPEPPVQVPRKGRGVVPIHIRIVTPPSVSYQTQITRTNAWLDTYNLELEVKSVIDLQHLTHFQVLDLTLPGTNQTCIMGRSSSEQNDLYINHRGAIPSNEIAIYFISATTPSYAGCASYPSGFPSACVISYANEYTLAHEIGHVLGLFHVNENYRLMTGNGTYQIVSPPPDLVGSELNTIWQSPFIRIIN